MKKDLLKDTDKDLIIEIEDKYGDFCLGDDVGSNKKQSNRRPKGFVEIYELTEDNEKQLITKSNLVVYVGRELIAQALMDQNNSFANDMKDEFIYWFGIGSGGVLPADPFDPIPPTNSDTDLASELALNATDSTCADFRSGSYYKRPLDGVAFEQDPANDDAWIIIRNTVTLKSIDAISTQISEAGLFTASSRSGGHSGPFHLFSRVTFPTIVKTVTRRLIFVWYLYT